MKKILKMLVLGLLSAALLCCALPSAFAAEDKDSQVYTIGLDAMGGSSSAVAVTTNLSGKLPQHIHARSAGTDRAGIR